MVVIRNSLSSSKSSSSSSWARVPMAPGRPCCAGAVSRRSNLGLCGRRRKYLFTWGPAFLFFFSLFSFLGKRFGLGWF